MILLLMLWVPESITLFSHMTLPSSCCKQFRWAMPGLWSCDIDKTLDNSFNTELFTGSMHKLNIYQYLNAIVWSWPPSSNLFQFCLDAVFQCFVNITWPKGCHPQKIFSSKQTLYSLQIFKCSLFLNLNFKPQKFPNLANWNPKNCPKFVKYIKSGNQGAMGALKCNDGVICKLCELKSMLSVVMPIICELDLLCTV